MSETTRERAELAWDSAMDADRAGDYEAADRLRDEARDLERRAEEEDG